MLVRKLIAFAALLFMFGCVGGGTMSVQEMLEIANLKEIPPAAEYEEEGALILYENTHTQFSLDGNWEIQRNQKYHRATVYYNDNAEDYITQSIYLDGDRKLVNFAARTIRPDGSIVELSRDDLIKTSLKEEFIEYSDDESVKFTFKGVEPGSILEFSYEVAIFSSFSWNDKWYIQNALAKKYTKYSVQIPTIFFRNKINWNYVPVNVDLPAPESYDDITKKDSYKDKNKTFYWEVRDVEALEYEPNRPHYRDLAKYCILGIQRDSWNELTELYWKRIQDRFAFSEYPEIVSLAKELAADAETEQDKIDAIYAYTQQDYRYVAVSIGESGYIPNYPKDIISKKYGDCKDMTVLNVNLLKALGIEAYPALVRTKSAGRVETRVVDLDFNHMIAMVKTKDGKVLWLDATGSSCPANEIYSSIEGVRALILKEDGTSQFVDLPNSSYKDNQSIRKVNLEVQANGSVKGHAKLLLKGNENVAFRSNLKDATEKDMKKIFERYMNGMCPDIAVSNLKYDDPAEIKSEMNIEFDFEKDSYAIMANNLLIVNPYILQNDSDLDRFVDVERKYPIHYYSPHETYDEVSVTFDPSVMKYDGREKSMVKNYEFGRVTSYSRESTPNEYIFERRVRRSVNVIYAEEYDTFRAYLKDINKANNVNLTLSLK